MLISNKMFVLNKIFVFNKFILTVDSIMIKNDAARKNAFETFVFFVQHQLLEDSIHIRFQGTFHISLKICVPLFQAPFENISNNDHTNICRDILNILIWGNDSGTDTFLQIIVYSHDRVRAFGTDQWVQRLVFRSIIIRHKFSHPYHAWCLRPSRQAPKLRTGRRCWPRSCPWKQEWSSDHLAGRSWSAASPGSS